MTTMTTTSTGVSDGVMTNSPASSCYRKPPVSDVEEMLQLDGGSPTSTARGGRGMTVSYSTFYRQLQQQQQQSPSSSTSPSIPNCYVIVSSASAVWTALTLAATTLIALSVLTPYWLGAPAETKRLPAPTRSILPTVAVVRDPIHEHTSVTSGYSAVPVISALHIRTVSIGIFNECSEIEVGGTDTKVETTHNGGGGGGGLFDLFWTASRYDNGGLMSSGHRLDCGTYVTGFDLPDDRFPDAWKSALLLLTAAVVLLMFTCLTSLVSVCVQSLFGKSIFTVSGLIQSIAALLLVVGQLLYTLGWMSRRVRDVCGQAAGPFVLDNCSIGMSFYGCMTGTLLIFISALMSIRAENTTSTDQVEKLILHGRRIVCVW